MKKSSFWLRFGVWFWGLTYIYLVLFTGGVAYNIGLFEPVGLGSPSLGKPIGNFIGLFVPIGLNNYAPVLVGTMGVLDGHPVPAFGRPAFGVFMLVFCLIFAEKFLRKLMLRPYEKIIANLLILLFLTALIDFLTFKEWASFLILLGYPPYPIL